MNYNEPLFSIIIPAKNEGINVKNTITSMIQAENKSSYEIVVVDDNSSDQSCEFLNSFETAAPVKLITTRGVGLARAKQLGARNASGNILLFCDAHIYVQDNWLDALAVPLVEDAADAVCPGIAPHDEPLAAGYGQTWNSELSIEWLGHPGGIKPVPLLPGGCMAVKARAFSGVGGFDEGFKVWGYEDGEISMKLWLFGYRVCVNPEVTVRHIFRSKFPYKVSYQNVNYNMLRMAYSHFNEIRIKKTHQLVGRKGADPELIKKVMEEEVMRQRTMYLSLRKFDDNWFFSKFNIDF